MNYYGRVGKILIRLNLTNISQDYEVMKVAYKPRFKHYR